MSFPQAHFLGLAAAWFAGSLSGRELADPGEMNDSCADSREPAGVTESSASRGRGR